MLDQVSWNEKGLVAAIAQEASTGRVLMMAWMNSDALAESLESGYATYWSRSRAQIWRKGESSGNRQKIQAVELDCDGDTVLLKVEQQGGIACHTGRNSCFFRRAEDGNWIVTEPVLKSPEEIYGNE
jgi:phosphoribosyl-AMP cyclohydrolase